MAARGGHGISSELAGVAGNDLQSGRGSKLNRLIWISYNLTESCKGDSQEAQHLQVTP
jgi:hypothetical protein